MQPGSLAIDALMQALPGKRASFRNAYERCRWEGRKGKSSRIVWTHSAILAGFWFSRGERPVSKVDLRRLILEHLISGRLILKAKTRAYLKRL